MAVFREKNTKKIDMVFVLTLITLFGATALTLVLIGAKQYRFVTNTMNTNYETRTTSSYLTEKLRQNDKEGVLAISDLQGTTALSISTITETTSFVTYIYYYDGYLRELIVTPNSVFSLSSGQPIIPANDFQLQLIEDSLLSIQITDTRGELQHLYFYVHSGIRKEVS